MKLSLLTVAVLATVFVFWGVNRTGLPTTPSAEAPAVAATQDSETALAASPQAQLALAASEDPNVEIIQGYAFRKDRNCTVQIEQYYDDAGELRDRIDCLPLVLEAPDPYESYPEEVLEEMAYGDAHAAEVLGLRRVLSDDPETEASGLTLLLRAAAIRNDTNPIINAINNRYGHMESNGVLELENVKTLYVLSLVAGGVPGSDPRPGRHAPEYRDLLEANGVSTEEVQALASYSRRILQDMAKIQTEITGDRSIQEVIDEDA